MNNNSTDFNQSHFTKVVLQAFGLSIAVLLGIMSWYLNAINTNIKDLSNSVASVSTTTALITARIDNLDRGFKDQSIDFKVIKEKVSSLEKEAKSQEKILEHHAALIADKRRCVACTTKPPILGTDD